MTDPEMISQGEVESPLQTDQQQHMKNSELITSLGRQSSIYSLTLDEFQNTLSETGKNFGSMNMDEFLNSIWTAEENQAHSHSQAQAQSHLTTSIIPPNNNLNGHEPNISRQPSLQRQGSLTIPPPLSRKTVEEVWAEIHGTQQQPNNRSPIQNPGSSTQERQITFGEMTLEDFLVKAGVVREQCQPLSLPMPAQQQQQSPPSYSTTFYQNNNHPAVPNPGFIGARPVMSVPGNVGTYQAMSQAGAGDVARYGGGGNKRGGTTAYTTAAVYGGRMGNGSGGGGGFGQLQPGLLVGLPVSPVSSDGLGGNPVDAAAGNQYGMDMGGGMRSGGRKRIIDGPIEKVVERRQRRMIKNRESAARSRARKQAYTVELEAELNQLKEENAHLKLALAELERKRRQQFEEANTKGQTKAEKANEKLRIMRRSNSTPY